MSSSSTLRSVVETHARGLAMLRALLVTALRDSATLYKPRGRPPKGMAMSVMMRDKLIELALPSADLAADGLSVMAYGQDWVRITFRGGVTAPLRKRPPRTGAVTLEGQEDLFSLLDDEEEPAPPVDAFRDSPLSLVVLWDYKWAVDSEGNITDDILAYFGVAQVGSKGGEPDYQTVVDHVEISPNVVPLLPVAPPGSDNDDDELDDLIGRWDQDAPASEEEITDAQEEAQDKEGRGDDDASMGGRD